MLCDQLGLKTAYSVRVSKDCLRVVLRFVARAACFPDDEEGPSPEVDQFVEPSPPTLLSATKPLV